MTVYQNAFEEYMDLAKEALKKGKYSMAEEKIKQAMFENPHSPSVHNLYGILEELSNEDNLSRKHYRAAYALDPTYKPTIRNLERISAFEKRTDKTHIDFGDEKEVEEDNLYTVEYDRHHVGHLRKKMK
jgi:Flp pilus assembly protein TadD